MEGAQAAYEDLLGIYRETFPDLVDQIQEEVARGRTLKASELSRADRQAREARMSESKPGQRIANDEQAVVPYDDDERLSIALTALQRWLRVATSTRSALTALAESHGIEPVVRLSPPDEAQQGSEVVSLIMSARDLAAIGEVLSVAAQAEVELL